MLCFKVHPIFKHDLIIFSTLAQQNNKIDQIDYLLFSFVVHYYMFESVSVHQTNKKS